MDTDATVSIDTGLDTLTISWSHFTLRSYVPVSNFLFFLKFSDFSQQKCFLKIPGWFLLKTFSNAMFLKMNWKAILLILILIFFYIGFLPFLATSAPSKYV